MKILNKIGLKNRFGKLSLILILLTLSFLIIVKIVPSYFGIDWSKSKRQIIKNIDILHDESGNKITKTEGKKKYFKILGKTDNQIFVDEIATIYLRTAWVLPQLVPQFFNTSAVGGLYNISLVSTYISTHALKTLVHKKRPDGGNYKSFPSGHSSGTMVLPAFLHRFYSLKIASPFYILSIATGISRVYCNRHDFYDVISGGIIGFLCGFYTNLILIKIGKYYSNKSKFLKKIEIYLFEKQ